MKHLEDSFQKACATFLFDLEEIAQDFFFHHSPNGGRRTPREGKRFKENGTRAGYPDFVIHKYGGRTFLIELKVKGNGLNKSQKPVKETFERLGFNYYLIAAESDADALNQLKNIMLEEGL